MPPGTLIIVKPADPEVIRIGDVVTYQIESGKPEVITHRVIQIVHSSSAEQEQRFITQGDNNGSPDAEIRAAQIRGIVWYAVPWIGWINNVVNGDSRGIIIPIIAVLLFGYAGWMLVSSILGRRHKKRAVARAEQRAAAQAELEEHEARLARIALLESDQRGSQQSYAP